MNRLNPSPRRLAAWLAPVALAASLALPQAAAAQTYRYDDPMVHAQRVQSAADLRIRGFDVQAVESLRPGSELTFTVWGTPGARASVRIDGARRLLTLNETSPGYYSGVYVVGATDQVRPDSQAVAQLRARRFVTTATLEEPLQRDYAPPAGSAGAPEIDRVSARPYTNANTGERRIDFFVTGTRGGAATVMIPGARPRVVYLQETRPGDYRGSYTVRASDRLDEDRPVVARLRVGDRVVTSNLPNAMEGMRLMSTGRAAAVCGDCGVVKSVQRIEVEGDEGYVGAVAGGLLGAVLGSQVGGGDGKKAAGVAGAVGGALIGREIDKRKARHTQYEVVVRMSDGESRTFTYRDEPPFKVGQEIRVHDGALQLI